MAALLAYEWTSMQRELYFAAWARCFQYSRTPWMASIILGSGFTTIVLGTYGNNISVRYAPLILILHAPAWVPIWNEIISTSHDDRILVRNIIDSSLGETWWNMVWLGWYTNRIVSRLLLASAPWPSSVVVLMTELDVVPTCGIGLRASGCHQLLERPDRKASAS